MQRCSVSTNNDDVVVGVNGNGVGVVGDDDDGEDL